MDWTHYLAVGGALLAIVLAARALIARLIKRMIAAEVRAERMAEANRETARRAESDSRLEADERRRLDVVSQRDTRDRQSADLGELFEEAAAQRRTMDRERNK
jgi:hypothetical protein